MRTALIILALLPTVVLAQVTLAPAALPATTSAPATQPAGPDLSSPKAVLTVAHDSAVKGDWDTYAKTIEPGAQKYLTDYIAVHKKLLAMQTPVLKLAGEKLGKEAVEWMTQQPTFKAAATDFDPLKSVLKDSNVQWELVVIQMQPDNQNATVTLKCEKPQTILVRKYEKAWLILPGQWNPTALAENTKRIQARLPMLEKYYTEVTQGLDKGKITKDNYQKKLNDIFTDAVKKNPTTEPAK